MQTVAREKGVSVGRLVESIMNRYIEEPRNKKRI